MAQSQGGQANLTGKNLESFIEFWLKQSGYERTRSKKKFAAGLLDFTRPTYATQVIIGDTVYGSPLKCDFLLTHSQRWPEKLVIEAKWQQKTGSVDEKFPYLVANIRKSPFKTIIVLDGGGYKEGAEEWLRNQVDDKLLHVFSMVEFQTWVNAGNL